MSVNLAETPGSNLGPQSEAEALQDRLAEKHAALADRATELLGAEERLPAIENDDAAGKVGDYVKLVAAAVKAATAARVAEKEPFLAGGRTVDGFFASRMIDPLGQLKFRVENKLGAYLRAKADRERREREAEAARLAVEAAKREAEALAAMEAAKAPIAETALDAALEAQQASAAADKAAAAKPADMARTRGDYGSVATLRQEWTFADLARAELDLEALRQHIPADALERALRSFIKAGGRTIRGARIFQTETAMVR